MLLVLCTSTQGVQEEIWARQLGVWNYFPFGDDPPRYETASVRDGSAIGGSAAGRDLPNGNGCPPRIGERVAGPLGMDRLGIDQLGTERLADSGLDNDRPMARQSAAGAGSVANGSIGNGPDGVACAPLPLEGPFDHAGLLMMFSEARIALANMEASQSNTDARVGANGSWDLKLLTDTLPEPSTPTWPCQENGFQDGADGHTGYGNL